MQYSQEMSWSASVLYDGVALALPVFSGSTLTRIPRRHWQSQWHNVRVEWPRDEGEMP